MGKSIIFIFAAILLISVGIKYWFSISEENLCKFDYQQISYKRLSDERSYPFLDVGQPLSLREGKTPEYNEFRKAVIRFPDVRSCLVDSEREKQIPNLNRFDWNKIGGTKDAEVCLFRVFSSIGSVEGSEQWLKNQGFGIGGIHEVPAFKHSNFMHSNGEKRYDRLIDASWSFKECGRRIIDRERSLLRLLHPNWLFIHLFAHGFWVGAQFSTNSEVVDINVGYNTK